MRYLSALEVCSRQVAIHIHRNFHRRFYHLCAGEVIYLIRNTYLHYTAVEGVLNRTHRRCETTLTVTAVELDDIDQVHDLCRTFSVAYAPDNTASMLCTLHNYLNHVGVCTLRWHLDEANTRIVVVVKSIKGIVRLYKYDCAATQWS